MATTSAFSASTINADFNEFARCCVCYESYNRTHRAPISMPCGHTFCRVCIRQLCTEKLFSCAICRTVSLVGWMPTQKNMMIIGMLEKLNMLASDDNEEECDDTPMGRRYPEGLDFDEMISYGESYIRFLREHEEMQVEDRVYELFTSDVVDRLQAAIDSDLHEELEGAWPAGHDYDSDEDDHIYQGTNEDNETVQFRVVDNSGPLFRYAEYEASESGSEDSYWDDDEYNGVDIDSSNFFYEPADDDIYEDFGLFWHVLTGELSVETTDIVVAAEENSGVNSFEPSRFGRIPNVARSDQIR